MSGFLIIEWPHGNRRIFDHILDKNGYATWEIVEKYRTIFGNNVDWIEADQKEWLREHGFIT